MRVLSCFFATLIPCLIPTLLSAQTQCGQVISSAGGNLQARFSETNSQEYYDVYSYPNAGVTNVVGSAGGFAPVSTATITAGVGSTGIIVVKEIIASGATLGLLNRLVAITRNVAGQQILDIFITPFDASPNIYRSTFQSGTPYVSNCQAIPGTLEDIITQINTYCAATSCSYGSTVVFDPSAITQMGNALAAMAAMPGLVANNATLNSNISSLETNVNSCEAGRVGDRSANVARLGGDLKSADSILKQARSAKNGYKKGKRTAADKTLNKAISELRTLINSLRAQQLTQ